MPWIEVKRLDDDHTTYMIQADDFDDTIYRHLTEEEMSKSKKKSEMFDKLLKSDEKINFGISMGKSGTSHSPYYKGKLDSGAAEELMDQGLEGARDRGLERKKTNGKAFNRARQSYAKGA